MTVKITKQQVAEILGCTVRTVTTHQSQEIDPLPILPKKNNQRANVYDAVAIHKWDLDRQIRISIDPETLQQVEEMDPLTFERYRKTKAEATAQEMKNAVLRQELAPLILMELALSKWAEQTKSIMGAIPLKVKKLLPHMKAAEIEIIKRELVKVQNAISKIQLDWDELPND